MRGGGTSCRPEEGCGCPSCAVGEHDDCFLLLL